MFAEAADGWVQNLASTSLIYVLLVSTVQAGGCVMVWGMNIVADHVNPFMASVYHLVMATSKRIMLHVTKQKPQTGFMNMAVATLVTICVTSRTPLGCGRTGLQERVAEKSAKLHDSVNVPTWSRVSKESLQHPVELINKVFTEFILFIFFGIKRGLTGH